MNPICDTYVRLLMYIALLHDLRSKDDFIHGSPQNGIKSPCPFVVSLKSFGGVTFFGLEEMQLFGQGHARLLWSLFEGEHAHEQARQVVFALSDQVRREACVSVQACSINMSTCFSLSFVDPARNACNLHAVDLIDLMLVVYPTVVAERIVDKPARKTQGKVVYACSLSLQWRITLDDPQAIDKCFL